jgi:aspartyl aminopeptidase
MATTFDRTHTDNLLSYLAAAPTPYHAVAVAGSLLDKAGFRQLSETAAWDEQAGGQYVIRGGAMVAWYLPEGAEPSRALRILGSHTDSPNLRVRPAPDTGGYGWRQVGVEVYGGTLYNTWLDRDLGLAGRLTLRDGSEHLVNINRPLLRVPQLAIHLDRSVNPDGLKLNPQVHLTPVWGLGPWTEGDLIEFLAAESGLRAGEVLGWDLMLHDVAPPGYLGRDEELITGSRLDNLMSVHAAVTALLAAVETGVGDGPIPVLAAMDHEEIGSGSSTGAAGPFLETVLERMIEMRGGGRDARARAYAGSVLASADMAHAVHPNYPEKHDPGHRPRANGGPALKVNVNQRYATDGATRAVWARACEEAGVPSQTFVSRNDQPCGATIGPISATRIGIATFDVGIPGLSMHSVRELCGADDPWRLTAALAAFLSQRA